ncbi:type II secretion system protein GspM [Litoreibacter sp.]|nr:type II secretion system protein GspM [Litoreibacter sp.]
MKLAPAKRILIWGSVALVALLFWVAVISPILNWRNDTTARLTAAQGEAERLLTSIDNLQRAHGALSAETEFSDIWQAGSISEATAQVQASLGAIARQQGVTFRSIAPLQRPEMPLVSAVAFRIEAELTLDRLVQLLKALEYSTTLLLIERSNIRRLARGAADAIQPTVFMQLDIVAPVILPEDDA